MSRVVVDQLLSMLDQSFERSENAGPTDGWHSLMANLHNVREEDWDWLPPNGRRSICYLALHVGFAVRMYANHGFGAGDLPMSGAVMPPGSGPPTKANVIQWVHEGYQMLRDGIAVCDDDDLADIRTTHWGEGQTRRWFIVTMIEHNIYHAGEINHIRALVQKNDR